MIKLASLNTWSTFGPYEKRWPVLLEQLKAVEPHILFLQEATDERLLKLIQHETRLSHYSVTLKPGLAIMAQQPLESESEYEYKAVSPMENHNRGLLCVTLTITDQKIVCGNTHLSWKAEDVETRSAQVEEMLAIVSEYGLPAILAGDFNDVAESAPIQKMTRAGYRDLFATFNPKSPGTTWDNQNPFIQGHTIQFPDRRIDYFFVDPALVGSKNNQCRVAFNQPNAHQIYPSDHYGLLAKL